MSGIAQGKPVEYHVLKEGAMFGPLTEEELRAGVVDGRFNWDDFVQVEGQVVWQSLARVLSASEKDLKRAVPPDWRCILQWTWMRLRHNLEEQGALVGVTCLVLGALALVLSKWPIVFWLPWFVAAALAALALFRHKRKGAGAVILLAVICVPWLLHRFGPKATAEKNEHVARGQHVASEKAAVAEPKATPAPAPEAAPVIAAKTPEPTPDAITTVLPHYAPVPAEAAEATPPGATPAPGSLMSTAGKLAGAVMPFLVEKSKASLPSLPSLPGFAPAGDANADKDAAAIPSVYSHDDAFVTVKGSNGSGIGFACRLGGKTWLLSNVHVVSEIKQPVIKRLDGTIVSRDAAQAAAGPDVVRMGLAQAPDHPWEAITDFEANVHVGDDVAMPGNTGGGGVVTWLKGRVVGIGPDRVEVSMTFIPENSGGPLIHLKTGKVIGIASYLARPYEQFSSEGGNGSPVQRRFGYRIDNVPAWEPVDWAELTAEADQIKQLSKLTTDVFNFLESTRNQKEPTFATDTLRRAGQDWMNKVRVRGASSADRRSAAQGFLNALHFMVKADVVPLEPRLRYSYYRNRLKDEEKVRERLFQAFDSELVKVGNPLSR